MRKGMRYILLLLLICTGPLLVHGQIYVDMTASGADNGSSWSDAYTDLQDALGVALPGDQIWVADITYISTAEG